MYQAGIKNITLYENKGITFNYYDGVNLNSINNLSGKGAILRIENNQQPKLNVELAFSRSGKLLSGYTVEFFLFGLLQDNYDLINTLTGSIYGWCFLVEFYDGTLKYYNTPIFCDGGKINPSTEMSYSVELKSRVSSVTKALDYNQFASTIQIYRADTTILTADTTIYTADYAV